MLDGAPLSVYAEELTWRRYLPPLPRHHDYPPGWLLIGDAMLLMPVAMFCQITRINYNVSAGL
jgi:general transcription factor 3C polypeptide 1